jgi:hypothetical protein
MNMNHSPTVDELKQLFAAADDEAGHHSLWIDKSGEVHLSVIPEELTPIGFEDATPSMQIRFETYGEGLGYVGPSAAADDKFIGDTFRRLVKAWTPPFSVGKIKYVDY